MPAFSLFRMHAYTARSRGSRVRGNRGAAGAVGASPPGGSREPDPRPS